MNGRIHSIESFGTVDGPGIRFVVFMQGCPMRCMYCHNPDTWDPKLGKEVSTDYILEQYDKTKEYYTNGGLTVTGGEPMLQMDFLIELFEKAKQKSIHTCIDTSGITHRPDSPDYMQKLDRLMNVTDLVMLDIKHIDNLEHKKLTKQPNTKILEFARYLSQNNIPVWIRHVVVPGITDNEIYLKQLGVFIAELYNVKALDVLPYHTMGAVKYQNLGMEYPLEGVRALEKSEAVKARNIILDAIREKRDIIKNK